MAEAEIKEFIVSNVEQDNWRWKEFLLSYERKSISDHLTKALYLVPHSSMNLVVEKLLLVLQEINSDGDNIPHFWYAEWSVRQRRNGTSASVPWLESVFRNVSDQYWATKVLIQAYLSSGLLDKAEDRIRTAGMQWPREEYFSELNFVLPIYKGSLKESLRLIPVQSFKLTSAMSRVCATVAMLGGQPELALHFFHSIERRDLSVRDTRHIQRLECFRAANALGSALATKTYVITLSTESRRFSRLKENLSLNGVDFEHVLGVNGSLLPVAVIEKIAAAHPEQASHLDQKMVGCFLSHLRAWEIFLASESDYALFLEDDVLLYTDPSAVISALCGMKADFAFMNERMEMEIVGGEQSYNIYSLSQAYGGRHISNIGTDAYFLSRMAARKLVSCFQREVISMHLDAYLFKFFQSDEASELQAVTISPCIGGEYDFGERFGLY